LVATLADGVQQDTRADHVRAGESVLVRDRAVHMGLGGEVHDRVRALGELEHEIAVLDRADHQLHVVGQVLAPAGVGQLVEDDDRVLRVQHVHEGGADEAGGAGNEQPHTRTPR
jgi:hypothetical protein